MTVSRYQVRNMGVNPFVLEGPFGAVAGASKDGAFTPQYKLGSTAAGDSESEFVYCKLVLASATTMYPGQVYYWDNDFVATLMVTGAGVRGSPIGVGLVSAPASAQMPAGTYGIWLQRNGQAPIRVTALTNLNQQVESTATAGAVLSVTAPTSTSTNMVGMAFTKALATFTADVLSGSKVLLNLSNASTILDSGPFIGAVLTGTGLAASQVIEYIQVNPPGGPPGVSIVLSAAATVTNTGVTITPTLVAEGRLSRCYAGVVT